MDQHDYHRERVQGFTITMLPRAEDPVFEAALSVLDSADYQVVDVDRGKRQVRFTSRSDTSKTGWTYELGVESAEGFGTVLGVLFESPTTAEADRGEKRLAKKTARRVRKEVEAAVRQVEPDAAEAKLLEDMPGAAKGPLAGLTGRRAWLGALVLVVIYAVPLLVVWGVGQAAGAGLLGDSWVPMALGLVLAYGLFVAATVKLGAWVQLVEWGEEYMLTFGPFSGYVLGWWRFAVQLAGFIAIAFLAANIDEAATAREMNSAETAALPTYAQRAPVPEGAELISDDLRQSEYVGRPNATYTLDYGVPATYDLGDVEAFLNDPGWTDGVDGQAPVGALQDVACDLDTERCEAEVVPPAGEPSEYAVTARLSDSLTVVMDNGEEGTRLILEIEYEQAE